MTVDAYDNRHDLSANMVNHKLTRKITVNPKKFTQLTEETVDHDKVQTSFIQTFMEFTQVDLPRMHQKVMFNKH